MSVRQLESENIDGHQRQTAVLLLLFCCCDFNVDSITLILEVGLDILNMYLHTKHKLLLKNEVLRHVWKN